MMLESEGALVNSEHAKPAQSTEGRGIGCIDSGSSVEVRVGRRQRFTDRTLDWSRRGTFLPGSQASSKLQSTLQTA